MSTHIILATPEQEAHLRGVLDAWRTERGLTRTSLSTLLVGTRMLLEFWSGKARMSQTTMTRILIGCRAAGIEATEESLLGAPRGAAGTPAQAQIPAQETGEADAHLCDHHRLGTLEARVTQLEQLYSTMTLLERLEILERKNHETSSPWYFEVKHDHPLPGNLR